MHRRRREARIAGHEFHALFTAARAMGTIADSGNGDTLLLVEPA